jgi:sialidase-1
MTACQQPRDNPFWDDGNAFFDTQKLYASERFPNVVVAMDGTVVTSWGRNSHQIRRSEDGGKTWGPLITVSAYNWWQNNYPVPGFQGGGLTVDENTGDILTFVEDGHPPSPQYIFRSRDHGKTWEQEEVTIHPDSKGNMPSFHMNETGITLLNSEYAGRLIRPSRYYGRSRVERGPETWSGMYTNAMYSDDGGKTWQTSEPFPAYGTGEASIVELSDGTIFYDSRRTYSNDGLDPRWRHIARSHDGGHTWEDLEVSDVLPDGPQHHDYGLMGGLVRLPVEGHDILLFSNVDVPVDEEVDWGQRTTLRERGTIWASFDGGKTWPVKRLVTGESFAYSSLAAGREGTPSEGLIYMLYEGRSERMNREDPGRFDSGHIVRFNLAWVTEGRDWRDFLGD